MATNSSSSSSSSSRRRAPADDIVRHALGWLRPAELLSVCLVCRRYRELAENDVLWAEHCKELWRGKVHVNTRPELSRKLAYYASAAEGGRLYLTRQELLSHTFSFRFREAAGEDWVERDSWWQGGDARRVKFAPNGVLQIVRRSEGAAGADVLDDLPANVSLRWKCGFGKYAKRVRGGQHFAPPDERRRAASAHAARQQQRLRVFHARMPELLRLKASDVNVAALAAAAPAAAAAAAPPGEGAAPGPRRPARRSPRLEAAALVVQESLNQRSPQPLLQPTTTTTSTSSSTSSTTTTLDPSFAPLGDCLRVTVNGVPAPTYRVRRLASNWGLVVESCWAVYTSFAMPRRGEPGAELIEDAALRLSCAEQDEEIEQYNVAVAGVDWDSSGSEGEGGGEGWDSDGDSEGEG